MAQYKIIVCWCKIENAYPGVSAAACLKNACFSHIARFLCCIIQSDSSFPEVYNKGHVHSDTAISSNFFLEALEDNLKKENPIVGQITTLLLVRSA